MNFKIIDKGWLPYPNSMVTAELKQLPNELAEELERTGKLRCDQKPNFEVTFVSFDDIKNFTRVPKNLLEFFPRLECLRFKGGIEKICRDDVRNYKNLKDFRLIKTKVKELPSDLFADLENLEALTIIENDIKHIGKDIFKHLKDLKFVDLSRNVSINVIYVDKIYENLKNWGYNENTTKTTDFKVFNAIIDGMFPSRAMEDVKKVLKDENFKDFVIKVRDENFKVHKLMLAARSPTLAEMIKNNPDSDELILEDIEVEIFKIILDYIYDDVVSLDFDEKTAKVFDAAAKLKLKDLQAKIAETLNDAVDAKNYFEIFLLASKHNHQELKMKAFEEIKKLFPGKQLKDDLVNDLETVKKLIKSIKGYDEKKKEADEALKKIQGEFENVFLRD